MDATRLQDLPSRTPIHIRCPIVSKSVIAKDAFLASGVRCMRSDFSHVPFNPALLARHVVLMGAILVIGHYCAYCAARVLFMLIAQTDPISFHDLWLQRRIDVRTPSRETILRGRT
jgi:hypothetical protein